MKRMKQGLLVIALVVAYPVLACTPDGKKGFLPDHDLKIPAHAKRIGGLTETQFHDVITKVETLYSPIVSTHGGELLVERNWEDGTVNAYAQRLGPTWKVSMFGGLARHETVTEDGFALVVCHELGHHIGGAPRKTSPWSSPWASNEGQSDYFANLKCLRKVWNNDNNEEVVSRMEVPSSLSEACGKQYAGNSDRAVCIRGGMAGLSVAKLFQSLRQSSEEPKFETPDANVVTMTNDYHPDYQCRLDTYFQGSLCDVSLNEDVSEASEVTGTCHGSTGHTVGLRPLCWFKPSVE